MQQLTVGPAMPQLPSFTLGVTMGCSMRRCQPRPGPGQVLHGYSRSLLFHPERMTNPRGCGCTMSNAVIRPVALNQGNADCQGTFGNFGHRSLGVLLASSGQEPKMLFNTLNCTEQLHREEAGPKHSSSEGKKVA